MVWSYIRTSLPSRQELQCASERASGGGGRRHRRHHHRRRRHHRHHRRRRRRRRRAHSPAPLTERKSGSLAPLNRALPRPFLPFNDGQDKMESNCNRARSSSSSSSSPSSSVVVVVKATAAGDSNARTPWNIIFASFFSSFLPTHATERAQTCAHFSLFNLVTCIH